MQRVPITKALGRTAVTGADGFIGAALRRRLESMDVPFLALDRVSHESGKADTDSTGRALLELRSFRPQVVYHIEGSVQISEDGPWSASEHNPIVIGGTGALLKAAVESGVELFVFFSSCSVMQEGVDRELDESDHPMPVTAYGRAKLVAEGMVKGMDGVRGMRTVSLRLPMLYGPGHKGHLARMIAAIERGLFPPLPALRSRRSLIHVEDVVDAAVAAAQQRVDIVSRAYFVTETRGYSSRDLYEIIHAALGRRPPRWHVPLGVFKAGALAGDIGGRVAGRRLLFNSELLGKLTRPALFSPRLIEQELGFTASRTFASSASELVSSGSSQGRRQQGPRVAPVDGTK